MLTVTAPDPLDGGSLREQLSAAGLTVERDDVLLVDGELTFVGLGESDRATVEGVIASHDGQPTAQVQEAVNRRQQLDGLRDLARDVWRGDATFANTQAQRILAGLVLHTLADDVNPAPLSGRGNGR